MSSAEAIDKLQKRSAERASRIFALIEDLSEPEVLEGAEDSKDAREALTELESIPGTVPYKQLRREAGLDH